MRGAVRRRAVQHAASLLALLLGSIAGTAHPAGLTVREVDPLAPSAAAATPEPDQLPHSRVARGDRDIAAAWLAGPTDRYKHGVLGDRREAARLAVRTHDGRPLHVELPVTRVFEDREPRLADLDGDGRDEILVVESDTAHGAALAVYGIQDGQLVRRAATPFIGRPHRWLNPLGVGDFDGDGKLDLALVATPHVGGLLRLYRFTPPVLTRFAEYPGVSTHRIGSPELGLGRVVPARPRDRMLLPDQHHEALVLLEWTPEGWREVARVALSGRLDSSLVPAGERRWRFRLSDGRTFEVSLGR